jgi:hypothetical protein
VADDGFAHFRIGRLEEKPYANVLRPRASKAELPCEVVAQRAGDEEQRLAVFDRRLELAMRAGEHRRTPRVELVGLETACKKHRIPAVSSELALELARADGRDCPKRAKAKKIEALLLLVVEWELVRAQRGKELACIVDTDEATGASSCGRELRGEGTRR